MASNKQNAHRRYFSSDYNVVADLPSRRQDTMGRSLKRTQSVTSENYRARSLRKSMKARAKGGRDCVDGVCMCRGQCTCIKDAESLNYQYQQIRSMTTTLEDKRKAR